MEIPNCFFAEIPKTSKKEQYKSPHFIKTHREYYPDEVGTFEDVTEYAKYMLNTLASIDFRSIIEQEDKLEYLDLVMNITRNIFLFKNIPHQIKDSACRRMYDMSRYDIGKLENIIKRHFKREILKVIKDKNDNIKRIDIAKEINTNLGMNYAAESLFKKINNSSKSDIEINFKDVIFMSRAFAQEYVYQKNKTYKNIVEKNKSEDIQLMFDVVKKDFE